MNKAIVIATALLMSSFTWAHGEDKPGPHGGYVRMPGAFHTEIVPSAENQFKIYLLDASWKNPSVKNSQVIINYLGKTDTQSIPCQQEIDFYLCRLAGKASFAKGKLSVRATRENMKGAEVFYNLPFSFDNGGGQVSHEGH